jgi:hypothetical protein
VPGVWGLGVRLGGDIVALVCMCVWRRTCDIRFGV